jgi:hypothetical protein
LNPKGTKCTFHKGCIEVRLEHFLSKSNKGSHEGESFDVSVFFYDIHDYIFHFLPENPITVSSGSDLHSIVILEVEEEIDKIKFQTNQP